MATMRPLLRRVELSWIAFLLVGALCGALVMFGVDALRQSSTDAPAAQVVAPVPAANTAPIGGRLGGVVSSDTATGWYLLHEFNPSALPSTGAPDRDGVLGQRDVSAPTPVPQRIVGPGEVLNSVAPDNSTNDSIPPIIDPAQGSNPKR